MTHQMALSGATLKDAVEQTASDTAGPMAAVSLAASSPAHGVPGDDLPGPDEQMAVAVRAAPIRTPVWRSSQGAAALWSAAREVALVAFALLAYLGVRLLVRDGGPEALANAHLVVRFETALHFAWEEPLQRVFLDQVHLVRLLNWVYVWGHWPVLVACVAHLYVRRREVYRRLRTSMIISGLIGLLLFLSFPVAPPRLAAMGVCDTIKRYDSSYQEVARPSRFTNQYAAMPSFHFGWNLLCGVCLAMTLRRRGPQALALGLPLLMGLAIVVTGNHYIIDGVVGAVLAMFGLALCVQSQHHQERRAALVQVIERRDVRLPCDRDIE